MSAAAAAAALSLFLSLDVYILELYFTRLCNRTVITLFVDCVLGILVQNPPLQVDQ